jgi:Iron-sulfur cluster-binding domain
MFMRISESADTKRLNQSEELSYLFKTGYCQWKTGGETDSVHFFRPWTNKACVGFVSTRTSQDLSDYLDAFALRICSIVRTYENAGADDNRLVVFFTLLVKTLNDFDVQHIWHDKFKLRPMVDVSLKTRLLLEMVLQLGNTDLWPQRNIIQLFNFLIVRAEQLPPASYGSRYAILRAVLLAKGEYCLETGCSDEAIALARRAVAANGSCFTSEDLLVRSWRAKLKTNPSIRMPTEVAVQDLSERFCPEPFRRLVSGFAGATHLCHCPQWVPFQVGDILRDASVDQIWNSEAAMEIRRSVIDGDFSYCSRSMCPAIVANTLQKKSEVTDPVLRHYIDRRIVNLEAGPTHLQLSYDPSCNLACPSCRTDIVMAKPDAVDRYQAAKDRVVLPLLRKTHGIVMITGGGDPFASKHWRSVLAALNPTEYSELKLDILTNGLLLRRQWHEFPALKTMIAHLQISVDAARPKTYAIVRYPGLWEELRPNLDFISKIRRSGEIPSLGINFVVQKENFREMIEFIQLGKELGVDFVLFQRMFNFGSFTEEAFRERDVASPMHPDHTELCELLKHPLMRDPLVERSSLSSL